MSGSRRPGRRSYVLDRYLLSSFLPTLVVSTLFFMLAVALADLMANIVQYVQAGVSPAQMLRVTALYLPKCASWALPLAMLFSASYTLGTLYANNELLVVLGSGVRLGSFLAPLFAFALLASVAFLAFEDAVVVPSYAAKRQLARELIRSGEATDGHNDITIMSDGGRLIWNLRYYDAQGLTMSGVTVVERDVAGGFAMRLNAQSASWTGERWRFAGVRRFFRLGDALADETLPSYEREGLDEPPDSFRGGSKDLDAMRLAEAKAHRDFLLRAGLPAAAAGAEYYRRHAYALTPLLVTAMASAFAGLFRKNLLLMSLLVSLVGATIYYVSQMIGMLLAKSGALSPALGAFAPILIALAVSGLGLALRKA